MAKNLELKWIALDLERAYAEVTFASSDVDTFVNLQTVYSDVAASASVKPRALEVYIDQSKATGTKGLSVTLLIDTLFVPVYGRYRTSLAENANTLLIKAGSAACTLKFYSWQAFGQHFADNSVNISGQVSVADIAFQRVLNNSAYMGGVAIVTGVTNPFCYFGSSIYGNTYIERLTLSATQAGAYTLGLHNAVPAPVTNTGGMISKFDPTLNVDNALTAGRTAALLTPFKSIMALNFTANETKIIKFDHPILLGVNSIYGITFSAAFIAGLTMTVESFVG